MEGHLGFPLHLFSVLQVVERRVEVPYDVPVPYEEIVQVPHEVIRSVEIPVPVEQLVEKVCSLIFCLLSSTCLCPTLCRINVKRLPQVVERVQHVQVPVHREEHYTRQVLAHQNVVTANQPLVMPSQVAAYPTAGAVPYGAYDPRAGYVPHP